MVPDAFTWRARAPRQDAVLPIRATPIHVGATMATHVQNSTVANRMGAATSTAQAIPWQTARNVLRARPVLRLPSAGAASVRRPVMPLLERRATTTTPARTPTPVIARVSASPVL